MSEADAPGVADDRDPLESIRDHEAAVEAVAERDDQRGKEARVLLALAHDNRPDPTDLVATDLAGVFDGDPDGWGNVVDIPTDGWGYGSVPSASERVANTTERVVSAARRVEDAENGEET